MKSLERKQRLILGCLLLLSALLSFHMLRFVYEYAPVLLVQDRWDSLNPLFYDYTFWKGFTYQHGPHRMGLAYVFFAVNAHLSDWNGRWDMFLQAVIYIISALLAIGLKRRITVRYQWSDLLIPLIFISLQANTTVFNNPYVHGLIPFFALLIAHGWLTKNLYWRWFILSITSFVALFSGFGLMVGCAFVAVEFLHFLKTKNWRNLLFIVVPVAGIVYIIATQHAGGEITLSNNWLNNFKYLILLGGNFLFSRDSFLTIPLGLAALAVLGGLLVFTKAFWTSATEVELKVLGLLAGSSILFIILNLLGRAGEGVENALSLRYIPGTMPLMFAIYLLSLKVAVKKWRYFFLGTLGLVLLQSQVKTLNVDKHITRQHEKITQWEECLQTHPQSDYGYCYEKIGYTLGPDPKTLQAKITFLKENKLNIFRED